MAIILFISKLILSSGLLYLYYQLFLRNKRFHHYNRFYLLGVVLIAIAIPFINIPVNLFWGNQQHPTLIQTLKVINANGWEEPVTVYARRNQWIKWLNLQNSLYVIYVGGLLTGIIIFLRSLVYISILRKKYPCETIDHLKIYQTREPGTPFSFFRSIFWDNRICFSDRQGQQIFRHEMFHVKEKHSADILLMEILCAVCWFNPFFHLIKKELRAIHEFLADEYAVSASNRYEYAELLVLHAIKQKTPQLTHPFFHNQIKRRITMITQSNIVRRSGYLSRIMALPLLFVLVSAFAVKLTGKPSAVSPAHHAIRNITVVIDAGHGGIYEGSHNESGLKEKDINLSIANKLKLFSGQYNVNVVLTRSSDAVVGNATDLREDLMNRVTMAEQSKADLFISIHVNASAAIKTDSTGFEAYVSGRRQNTKDRQLASTLLTSLQAIYATDNIIKQRETGVVVIDKPACPAVLLECGYINNAKDAAFISNAGNQEKIACKILEAIVQYSNAQTGSSTAFDQAISSDTLTAEALSKLNPDDIKSLTVDARKNLVKVYFKNGQIKYADVQQVNDYYTANHIDGKLKGYRTNINMKDSVADIRFTKDTVPATTDRIFTKVEYEADYPGGQQGWIKYLTQNLHYPDEAVKKSVHGTVVVQFIVDTDGKVSDVKAISGPKLLQAESIRVVKESGNWTSALQNGKKVKAYKRQPIIYKLA